MNLREFGWGFSEAIKDINLVGFESASEVDSLNHPDLSFLTDDYKQGYREGIEAFRSL